jgi:fucose permease
VRTSAVLGDQDQHAQAFNGIGTVVAPTLGSYVFFKNVGEGQEALKNVQWVYLAIACFVFLLAVVFYFSPVSPIVVGCWRKELTRHRSQRLQVHGHPDEVCEGARRCTNVR